jgi:hypothetical protein
MKYLQHIFTLLLLTYCSLFSHAQEKPKGISVRPVTVDFSITPGQTDEKRILITNTLDIKKQFIVYAADWERDTVGAHVYREPSEHPRSCAKWVELDKTFFELEPGQTEELNVKLNSPTDSSGNNKMKWCMLFIETTQEKKIKDTTGLTTTIASRFRVGVHIYQNPPGINSKEIRLLELESLRNENNRYRIICENTGGVQLNCTSYLELASLTDGNRIKLPAIEFPIFPSQKRYLDFEIPASIPKGKYLLTGIIDAGEEVPLEAGQLSIEIK